MKRNELAVESIAVHAGREDLRTLGVHAPPLDLSTTYPLGDLDRESVSLDVLAAGGAEPPGSPVYARLYNPTVARFERALAALEGTEDAVAFSSGMAALTACLLAVGEAGRRALHGLHVVAVRPLYGTSDHLLASGPLGVEVTWATAEGIREALRPDTALVMIETPANPTLALVDIADVVAQAGGPNGVPVLVDSTFATPVLQQPARHGAALVLHSATKFLGGHGDVLAGVVATSTAWAARLRQVRVMTGAVLHPLAGYLLHRGLPTLPLRVERSQATAQELATRLAAHPAVVAVNYPGLPGGDPHHLLGRQLAGPGAVLAFDVGSREAARALLGALELITPAVSLGATDSLIQHPAGLTHRVMPPEDREATGITEGLLRLSVGLEAPRDLWADLERGFVAVAAAQAARGTASPELVGAA